MLMERQDFGKSLSILLRTNLSILNANSYTDPDSQRNDNTLIKLRTKNTSCISLNLLVGENRGELDCNLKLFGQEVYNILTT